MTLNGCFLTFIIEHHTVFLAFCSETGLLLITGIVITLLRGLPGINISAIIYKWDRKWDKEWNRKVGHHEVIMEGGTERWDRKVGREGRTEGETER